MFRGGDYVDNPKFYANDQPAQIKNSLDVSDIAGAKAKNFQPLKLGRDNIGVMDINGIPSGHGKPPMYQQQQQQVYPSQMPNSIIGGSYPQQPPSQQRAQAVNNVIIPIGGDEDYKQALMRKPTYLQQNQQRQDDRVAGVKYRPKTGERSMNEVFSVGQYEGSAYGGSRIEGRSLATHDINGTEQGRNYQEFIAAGVKNGSPQRKNESTVFAHLQTDGSEREGLKRSNIYDIQKPKVIPNNLSAHRQQSNQLGPAPYEMAGPSQQPPYGEPDELTKQFEEYYKLQQKMSQLNVDAHRQPGRNSASISGQQPPIGTYQPAAPSGFTKNYVSTNLIAHDVPDVRAPKAGNNNTLLNNGNEIFNSGGYGGSQNRGSRRSMQEQRFEQNFQKPMADRINGVPTGDYIKNYQNMRAAGGAINLDPNARKPSVVDGKSRLFGLSDENEYSGAMSGDVTTQSKNSGKRVMGPTANTFNNVIGGNYVAGEDPLKPQSTNKLNMMYAPGAGVPPIQHHQIDMYQYPAPVGY